MKLMILFLTFVAMIGCANSAPVSDEVKSKIDAMISHSSTIEVPAGVKKMLEIVHRHFPTVFDIYNTSPFDSDKIESLTRDLAELGIQEGCDEIDKHDVAFNYERPNIGDMTEDEWMGLVATEAKKNPLAKAALEANYLCHLFESNDKLEESVAGLVEFYDKKSIPSGVKEMLEIARRHFPTMFDMWNELEKDDKIDPLVKDLAKLGKQEGCRKFTQNSQGGTPKIHIVSDENLMNRLAMAAKNSTAFTALEAYILCRFLEEDGMYKDLLKKQ